MNARIVLLFLMCTLVSACSDGPTPLTRDMVGEHISDMADLTSHLPDMPMIPSVRGELPKAPEQSLAECGTPRLGLDLSVCTASYIGGAGADVVSQVAIAPDGTIVLAGVFPGVSGFGPLNNEFGFGGEAAIVKLDPTGRKILAWSRIGRLISALDVSPRDGTIVAGGSFGVMALTSEMESVAFEFPANSPELLDVGFDGEVAWFAAMQLSVFDPGSGEVLGSFDVEGVTVHDLVVDSWNQRLIITGFEQVSSDLQQPFIKAYGFDGGLVWSAWGWSAEQARELGSDTRGKALAIGYDGKLYFAGEAHGGETVFKRDPRQIERALMLEEEDDFARAFDLNGSAPIGFVARFDLGTGTFEQGTFLVTRLSSGKGNAARPTAIAANERGEIVMVGESACCIKDGEDKRVMGQPAMPDFSGGAFVAIFDGQSFERKLWTALHGGANASMRDVDTWGKAAVVVQEHVVRDDEVNVSGSMILHESFFDMPQGGASELHITVIPLP